MIIYLLIKHEQILKIYIFMYQNEDLNKKKYSNDLY